MAGQAGPGGVMDPFTVIIGNNDLMIICNNDVVTDVIVKFG